MSIAERIAESKSRAERMIDMARGELMRKAASAMNSQASLMLGGGNELPALDPRSHTTGAAELYGHFKGWVYAAVRLVAQRVAAQEICVGRVGRRNTRGIATKSAEVYALKRSLPECFKAMADRLEPLPSHTILDLLADPNDLMTSWGLLYVTVSSLELSGRSLWWVTTEGNANAKRLSIYPIPTHWIEQVDAARDTWTIRPGNTATTIDIPGEQIVHFYYPDPADPLGCVSPLRQIAAAVLADEAISQAQVRTFTQGQWPGLIIKVGRLPNPNNAGQPGMRPHMTPSQRAQLVTSVRKICSGVTNFHEPMIVDGMIEEVSKLTFSPAELDFLNSSKSTKARILQGYGVSPILLGEVEGANRASATVADEIFCANKVNPLITLLSQSMTEWLGPMFSGNGEKLAVWITPAQAHDSELSQRNWTLAASRGFVTPNEFRRSVLNLPDIEGGDELPEPGGVPAVAPEVKGLIPELNPYSLARPV